MAGMSKLNCECRSGWLALSHEAYLVLAVILMRPVKVHSSIEALVSDPRMTVRVPPAHVPLDRVRSAANAAMEPGPSPALYSVENVWLADIRTSVLVRHYRPSSATHDRAILFCHGGGFVWGSLDTHDGLCRRMAERTGSPVISVDYRLSPEAPFPAAENDVLLVARKVLDGEIAGIDRGCSLSLCGDSAGGYLVFATTARLSADGEPPRRLVLIYPSLDPGCLTASHKRYADGPVLTHDAMKWFWAAHSVPETAPGEFRQSLSRFPPTFVLTAEVDPLCDEGLTLVDDLVSAGVSAKGRVAEGMVHGFLSLPLPQDVRQVWEDEIFGILE
jgi:acetyl esterase